MNNGSASANSDAMPVSPIPSALAALSNRQDITCDTIDELEGVIGMILQPHANKAPETVGGVRAVRDDASPLHGELNTRVERQGDINARLRSLIARVTL